MDPFSCLEGIQNAPVRQTKLRQPQPETVASCLLSSAAAGAAAVRSKTIRVNTKKFGARLGAVGGYEIGGGVRGVACVQAVHVGAQHQQVCI